ncbi:MAG: EAL domain-containing protein, partial [Betaproteobacteria bacterium]|nr:EAL domain-containing protein [Betaproteobacteria bacterium]
VEPLRGNEFALGLDTGRDERRRAALERARDTGLPAGSGAVTLVETTRQYGFLLRAPIYRRGLPVDTVDQRRAALLGFAGAVVRMDDFMAVALSAPIRERLRITIRDRGEPLYEPPAAPDGWEGRLARQFSRPIGGEDWQVEIEASGAMVSALHRALPAIALIVDLVLTLLIARLVHNLASTRERARGFAATMTRDLRKSEERLELALDGSGLCLWDCDLRSGRVYLSEGWAEMMGLPRQPTVTSLTTLAADLHPEDIAPAKKALIETLKGLSPGYAVEHRVRSPAGEWRWISSRGRVVARDSAGRATRFTGTNMDVTQRRRAEEQVQHMACHDTLSGLPNRALLEEHLRSRLGRARRDGARVAVLFMDIDRFKDVNDSLGHEAGDELLRVVARRLGGCLRSGDLVARLGGDEFAACLSPIRDGADAARVARKILDVLGQPFDVHGYELPVRASIGISIFPEDGEDTVNLLRNADTAMYHAKSLGRAQYQFFQEELNRRVQTRLSVERGLRRALERGQFRVHYQPQLDLATGRVVAVEALLRWEHPDRGLVEPAEFIAIAEESGLIVPIGRWVLNEACAQARRWNPSGLAGVRMGVNLSARQFREPTLAETVRSALADAGLPASQLELEITEGLLLGHDDHTASLMNELVSGVGVNLAVDDFGTGYSSLAYLKRLPIHRLKIDRAFIRDLVRGGQDEAIVAGVIAIARGLHLDVTAEGVESASQLECLYRLGCGEAQGYFIGRPVPPGEMEALLQAAAMAG